MKVFGLTMSARIRRLVSVLARAGRDCRGTAAVEFSLVLPLLIMLLFGLSELQPALTISRKVNLLSRTVADLTARSGSLTTTELKTIFGAATAIMRPYDDSNLTQIVATSVLVAKVGSTYVGTVVWSCGWNLQAGAGNLQRRTLASLVTVPPAFQSDALKTYILVEARYPYTPTIGYTISGSVNLEDVMSWPVRETATVTLKGNALDNSLINCPSP